MLPSVVQHKHSDCLCLISSDSKPAFFPFPPNSKPSNSKSSSNQQCRPRSSLDLSRRDFASLSLLSLAPLNPSPATALSIGISGPKDWLKDQKKKSSRFLLAPIDASKQSLRAAFLLLAARDSDYSNKDMEEIQKLLSSAARDCVAGERNSFISFQATTGIEVCTFRLILNNAASLLANKDPVKLEAESMLDDLIRSFTSLQTVANEVEIQVPKDRQRIAVSLTDTISSLDKFEKGVKDCLEI